MSALKGNLNVAPQEVYASSSTQGTDLGSFVTTGDSRGFRYVLASATALVAGKVQAALPQGTALQGLGVSAAVAAGAFSVTTSSSVTLVANQLAGGILSVRSAANTGGGFQYQISSHPAVTSGTVAFLLSDPIQVALTTGSVIDVLPSPYSGVVVAPSTVTSIPVGVAVANTVASNYGWVQTHGPADVLSDGAITVGTPVTVSTSVAGAVMSQTTGTQPFLGYAMITTTDQKFAPIFLQID